MKKIPYSLVLFLLFAFPVAVPAASPGYTETIQWWQQVRRQMVPYQLQLQELYSEVESSPGVIPSQVTTEFRKQLTRKYPGSQFFGHGGTFKINNYTTLTFNRQWAIQRLNQKFGDLVKSYDFTQNTLQMTSGANQISIKLDLKSPEESRFTRVVIPALTVSVKQIYQTRPGKAPSRNWMPTVIDDIYRFGNLHTETTRMDKFGERLLTDIPYREGLLAQARQLYQNPPQGLIASTPKPGRPKIALDLETISKTGSNLVKGVASAIPWYAYILLVGVVAAGGWNTKRRVNRYSRRLSFLEQLVRFLFGLRQGKDDTPYESQDTLNSPAEQKFQIILEDILDPELYQLSCKTRLADILKVKEGFDFGREQAAFNRISRKHVDFVISEKRSSRIIGVIELDDRSHNRVDRRKRDQQVDSWLRTAGIPILHQPCRREYSFIELQQTLKEIFGIAPRPFGDFR